jgi:hypothetical protein
MNERYGLEVTTVDGWSSSKWNHTMQQQNDSGQTIVVFFLVV